MSDELKNKTTHSNSLGHAHAQSYFVKAGAWRTLKCLANMAALVSGTAGSVAAMEALSHAVLAAEETSLAQEAQPGYTSVDYSYTAAAYRSQRNTELKLSLGLFVVCSLCCFGAQKSEKKNQKYYNLALSVKNSLARQK